MKKAIEFDNWASILVLLISVIASIFYFYIGIMEDNNALATFEITMFGIRSGALAMIFAKILND